MPGYVVYRFRAFFEAYRAIEFLHTSPAGLVGFEKVGQLPDRPQVDVIQYHQSASAQHPGRKEPVEYGPGERVLTVDEYTIRVLIMRNGQMILGGERSEG